MTDNGEAQHLDLSSSQPSVRVREDNQAVSKKHMLYQQKVMNANHSTR